MRLPMFAVWTILVLAHFFPSSLRGEEVWPGIPYASVKGYFYVPDGSLDQSILENGRLHSGVEKVVTLSPEDVAQLRGVLVEPPKGRLVSRKMCYSPHHAFIFYDAAREPVAHFEICFMCSNHRVSPPFPEEKIVDYEVLENLCKKLGLPQYKEFREANEPAAQSEWEKRELQFKPHLAALEAANEKKTSPPMHHAWPWIPFKKVKLCVFNPEGWNPHLVHLGKIN